MNLLTVIVVTHNRLDYTRRTIESLLRTTPIGTKFLIFDNHSDETGMREYLSSFAIDNPHDAYIVLGDRNLGWGAAVNIMLKEVKTDLVLISNNDVVYEDDWYEKLLDLYEKYPQVGIMAVWKHTAHGVKQDLGDLIVKDQMPAVGWLMKMNFINTLAGFPEHGPCSTKGGNGEDVAMCIRTEEFGFLVAAPKEDVAYHIDGY